MDQTDGRKARGAASRRAILDRAVHIASRQGLDGLTIGTIAGQVSLSKSGVAALFGSRQQLQLAVIERAVEVFSDYVIVPARTQLPGIRRLCALIERWSAQSENRLFEGGCFFLASATDFDSKPGAVRDAVRDAMDRFDEYVLAQIEMAHGTGELPRLDDAEQLAFEIRALYSEANSASLLRETAEPYVRARLGIVRRLLDAGADPGLVAQSRLMP